MLSLNVSKRDQQPEIMDQPGLSTAEHILALRGLQRINRMSGSSRMYWKPICQLANRLSHPLRVLDIATGGGDVPLWLWRKAGKAGIELRISGCDMSETAIDYARRCASEQGAQVDFFCADIFDSEVWGEYDLVISSLFLHHLTEQQAVAFLRRAASLAKHLLLVNDLRRCTWGLILATLGTYILSSSPIVRTDGPLSVRAAFTEEEVGRLAHEAGFEEVTIRRKWPCRFLMTWEKRTTL